MVPGLKGGQGRDPEDLEASAIAIAAVLVFCLATWAMVMLWRS